MLAQLGRTALLLTAIPFLIGASSSAQQPEKPAPDLTGLWMIDFEAMENHPEGAKFLGSWYGQMVRTAAFHKVVEFTPDGGCVLLDHAARLDVSIRDDGSILACTPKGAPEGEKRECTTFVVQNDNRLLMDYEEGGLILQRVSRLETPADDAALLKAFAAMQGHWAPDVELFRTTEWFLAQPEDRKGSIDSAVSAALRRVDVDGEQVTATSNVPESPPMKSAIRARGFTSDGGLIVHVTVEGAPDSPITAVIHQPEPDLIWFAAGLECRIPFRRVP